MNLVGRTYFLDMVPIEESDYVNVYGFDVTETRDIAHRLNLITNGAGGVIEYTLRTDGDDSISFASDGCGNLLNKNKSWDRHDPHTYGSYWPPRRQPVKRR